ncbi:unnamed protein product, partial [Musa banksii]
VDLAIELPEDLLVLFNTSSNPDEAKRKIDASKAATRKMYSKMLICSLLLEICQKLF